MKCGGITEALRIIDTAKSLKLKTMIGCMSESSVAIAAAASISGVINHIDLDSHYNLNPDPSEGVEMIDGITTPKYIKYISISLRGSIAAPVGPVRGDVMDDVSSRESPSLATGSVGTGVAVAWITSGWTVAIGTVTTI